MFERVQEPVLGRTPIRGQAPLLDRSEKPWKTRVSPKRFEDRIQHQLHPGQGRRNGQGSPEFLNREIRGPYQRVDQNQIPEVIGPRIGIVMDG